MLWLREKEPMSWEAFEELSTSITRNTAEAILRSFEKSKAFRAAAEKRQRNDPAAEREPTDAGKQS